MPKPDYYARRKKALKAAGVRPSDIAAELDVRRPNVTRNLQGNPRGRNRRIEALVARRIGKPLHWCYPEWYTKAGSGR